MLLSVDIVASLARHVVAHREVLVCDEVPAQPGTLIVGRVLDDKAEYNQLEDLRGEWRTVRKGQIVVGALGVRRALRGYAGDVPERVEVGDIVHLLNAGGVMGRCTSYDPQVGPPARVEVLGAVQHAGMAANMAPGPVLPLRSVGTLPPVIAIAGTCMHAGKTAAGCAVIERASRAGLRVAAAKLTGVALRRDTSELQAAGAFTALTFADVGLPSTCTGDVVGAARGVLTALAHDRPDVIVAELGDGLLGDYGVLDILADEGIGRNISGLVLSASDPVAAWGGVALLERIGLRPSVITGPATDNFAGVASVERATGVSSINARLHPEALAVRALGPRLIPVPPELTALGAA